MRITDCRNRTYDRELTARRWNVDLNKLGRIYIGDTACFPFQIRTNPPSTDAVGVVVDGEPIYVDSITVDDPRITLKLPGRLPVKVNPGQTYVYTVCFNANEFGQFKFPVITWVRRQYPTHNLTTYAIADTGWVTVVKRPEPKRDTMPRDTTPVRRLSTVDTAELEPRVTDPTTFRTIVGPNAVIPKAGTFHAGIYDLLGLTASYSITDNVMVIAGGAIPTPDDWSGTHGDIFGAYSLGVKAGTRLGSSFDIAAGFQWGRSIFDRQNPLADTVRSTITVSVPYAAISYGNDDSRLSVTAGYAFKHHVKPHVEFDKNAMIVAIGGDHRIAQHWKVAGELITMETAGVVPIVATARYFTNTFAIDAGLAYVGITTGDAKQPAIPVAPVISALFVF